MRQPKSLGNGRRAQDPAGWTLCWLAMVALVAISFAGSQPQAAPPSSTVTAQIESADSLDLEIAQFQSSECREGSEDVGEPQKPSHPSEGQTLDATPQG